MISDLTQAYINYMSDTTNLPVWKRQLYGYQSRPSKPVTLPLTDMETAHKALEELPPLNTDPESY